MRKPKHTERWFVSRQFYAWPDSYRLVEVAAGGSDYANPDMLCAEYPGEGQEYDNPVDAVAAAIEVSKHWSHDEGYFIGVGLGNTMGNTMPFDDPFDGEEPTAWEIETHYQEIQLKAQAIVDNWPQCPMCQQKVSSLEWTVLEIDEKFCSEDCSNAAWDNFINDQAEEEEEEETDGQCYYGCKVPTDDLWECETCGEEYCEEHWHETSLGRNVECVACERERKEGEE